MNLLQKSLKIILSYGLQNIKKETEKLKKEIEKLNNKSQKMTKNAKFTSETAKNEQKTVMLYKSLYELKHSIKVASQLLANNNSDENFYNTVTQSKYFQEWINYQDDHQEFDISESIECGVISKKHFDAFIEWIKKLPD